MRFLLLALIVLPLSALAADGVFEINQACVNQGCFGGDDPGFPVTLERAGSYRLTGNLDVRAADSPENVTAIEITEDEGGISLDLGGYTILGPVSCAGSPVTSCAPSGTGYGVVTQVGNTQVALSDGVIQGMGNGGVLCVGACTISNLRVVENGGTGIVATPGGGSVTVTSVLTKVIAMRNGFNGISASGNIINCISIANSADGIQGINGRVVAASSSGNGGDGVSCSSCSLMDSVAEENGGVGVDFSGNSIYGRNILRLNTMGFVGGNTALQVDENLCGASPCP